MTGEFDKSRLVEIHLDGEEAFLRELTPADAQAYFNLIDFKRSHFSEHGEEATSDKYQSVQDVLDSFNKIRPNYHRFGIWEDCVMVGSVNLEVQEQDEQSADVGYWVGAEHAGRGYARRAARLIQEFAFRNLQLERIFAIIHPENSASIKSVERAGFTQTDSGEKSDLRFELTREQFDANQSTEVN
jgi:ribosomal-protein-alanine N-acetyltransferase